MKHWRRESVLDLYNLVLAALLFVSPWIFAFTNRTGKLDVWLTSAAIVAISVGAMFAYANWAEWANLLLGLWLVVSPWLLGFTGTRAMHFSVAVGAVVAFLAALELFLHYDETHYTRSAQDQVTSRSKQHG